MGQCAPSSPTGNWSDSIADDEISIVVAPSKISTPQHSSRSFESKEQLHFLQPHSADVQRRCHVDQNEIKRVMWLQSDEILRRAGQLKMHGRTLNGKKGEELQRRQRIPVLRLKIKANVAQFYTEHYLKMFPNQSKPTIPKDIMEEERVPQLTCESSYSSLSSRGSSQSWSSSSNCEFGAYYQETSRSMPPMTPIKCPMTNDPLFDLAIIGCLGLVPRDKDQNLLRSSRRQLKEHCRSIPDHCMVLMNTKTRSPLAVCVLDDTSRTPFIRIYSTKKTLLAQQCATTTKELGLHWVEEHALYTWAEIEANGDFPYMNFAIFLTQRFDGCFPTQPRYEASFDWKSSGPNRPPVMRVMGRTEGDRQTSGCALIWMQEDDMASKEISESSINHSFRISLAKGIDPTLFVCFTAVVDEILESSMRTRCKHQTRPLSRTDSFSLSKKRMEARRRASADSCTMSMPCNPTLCGY